MMQGKVFAVTGAGSGIGRATAMRLAELGAQGIAISDVNEAALEETKALCMHLVAPVQICSRLTVLKAADIRQQSH